MSLTRLSVTCFHPPVIPEGVPEPTRLSDHVQKTEVSTGGTQWAASWHKPSGSLAEFLSSNYIHHSWWQLHDFYFPSRATKCAYCYGSHTRTGTAEQKKRAGCHFTMQAQDAFEISNLCLHFWHFAKSFGGLQEEICCLYHRMEHQFGCYSHSW